jgi:molybdopterin-guanine dinucleotide biosynthesis protein B
MPTPSESFREQRCMTGQRDFGVTGWKNSGKTTLVERLVTEFVRRGWRVSTIKHAHHAVDIDQPGTDSFRHRLAGASEVALVGGLRYAIMREQAEPTLAEVLARLAPADLVLIEGYKREPHPKIEVRAGDVESLAAGDSAIVAIASDVQPSEVHLPWFRRDDIAAIADFISGQLCPGKCQPHRSGGL